MSASTETQAMAQVIVTKMKDCPILTEGRITPLTLQSWTLACKRYMKHAEKKPNEIVSFVAEAILEPRLIGWYQADQGRIDLLSLDDYLKELASLVLDKNWAHDIQEQILSSRQGDRVFIDWKIEVENLNAILMTSTPSYALSRASLKNQLHANLNPDLHLHLNSLPPISSDLADWSMEVKERDEQLKAERERTQRMIDASHALRAARRGEKKSLAERITAAPNSSNATRHTSSSANTTPRLQLPPLTPAEKLLLNENDGCTRCRKLFVSHRHLNCPMTANNTWPDVSTYVTLTADSVKARNPASHAAGPADEDSDSYVTLSASVHTPSSPSLPPDPPDSPFTVPHLFVKLEMTGPSIPDFPIRVKSLLDIGCPSTVISDKLIRQLGLRRYPLSSTEDNLSTLSNLPMTCTEYVKLKVTSGRGQWKSGTIRAKVHVGLLVPIILGMPFLDCEHIVIDCKARTAIDRRSGYDILNPPPRSARSITPEPQVPPPTPKKIKATCPSTLEEAREPALAGYLLPAPVIAEVREHIETLAFQTRLEKRDVYMKEKYADRFPTRLPDNIDNLPSHLLHHIHLRNKDKVANGKRYQAPKKYQELLKARDWVQVVKTDI